MKPAHLAIIGAMLTAACQHATAQPAPAEPCPPPGFDRATLIALRDGGFAVADTARRTALARGLLACLADPDPVLRDGVAFEGLSRFLRARQLSADTMRDMEARLRARLTEGDAQGFARPFAALTLAELARADRIEPYLTTQARAALLAAATEYVRGVRDYRGFDDRDGWRHGVAHGADMLVQLALNPALGRADLDRILATVESQITPEGHFYIYGESERLAAPVLMIARRNMYSEAEWTAWLAARAQPAPLNDWREAFSSTWGLAQRHNTAAFFAALYVNARVTAEPAYAPLLPGIEAALRALP